MKWPRPENTEERGMNRERKQADENGQYKLHRSFAFPQRDACDGLRESYKHTEHNQWRHRHGIFRREGSRIFGS